MKSRITSILFIIFVITSCATNDDIQIIDNEHNISEQPEVAISKAFELTEAEAIAADNSLDFNYQLFEQVCREAGLDSNQAMSPMSATIALSMLANVTSDDNAEDICKLLGCDDIEALTTLSVKYLDVLPQIDATTKLAFANGLWYTDEYSANKSVIDSFAPFNALVEACDFESPATVDNINNWASRNTEGLIPRLFDKMPDNALMVLANAFYFNGSWANPFDEEETAAGTFYGAKGDAEVKFMHNLELQHCVSTNDYKAVKMDIGSGEFYALFILPTTNIESVCNADKLKEITSKHFYDELIDLKLPKFKYANERPVILTQTLKSMGLNCDWKLKLFTEDKDACMDLYQKTSTEFNEKGAEGASVTWVVATTAGVEEPVIEKYYFDRPFIFMINSATTDATLLGGVIANL